MWKDLFSPARQGTCLCCQQTTPIITPSASEVGVCDVCSYALRHAWQRAQGERIAALVPKVVRTYVLIPRLPRGRVETDLSAYEFLTDLEGNLPYLEWAVKEGSRTVPEWLETAFGITTWQATLRSCYLGYSGSADFAEVILAWAWGKSLVSRRSAQDRFRFAKFTELLGAPTPDAGFYLGAKVAFEALLWRLEMQPEANKLCVVMRELAMNYLRTQNLVPCSISSDDEDLASMSDAFRASMTSDELTVAAFLIKASEEEARVQEAKIRKAYSTPAKVEVSPGDIDVDQDNEAAEGDEGEIEDSKSEIPEGFARSPRDSNRG